MKFVSVDIDFLDIYSKNLDEEYKNFHLTFTAKISPL